MAIDKNTVTAPSSKFREESKKQLGERIRIVWKNSKLLQEELSDLLEISSVTLSNYMKGKRVPDALFINRLAEELNICLEWLLYGRGPMRPGESPPEHVLEEHPKLTGCAHCNELYAKLDTVNDRLYKAMQENSDTLRENGDLKEEIGRLKSESAALKNGQPKIGYNSAPMANAS